MRLAMAANVQISEADLMRAWRDCALRNFSFKRAMEHPALAIAIRNLATANIRRQQRMAEQQQQDCKRAQSNDLFDQ